MSKTHYFWILTLIFMSCPSALCPGNVVKKPTEKAAEKNRRKNAKKKARKTAKTLATCAQSKKPESKQSDSTTSSLEPDSIELLLRTCSGIKQQDPDKVPPPDRSWLIPPEGAYLIPITTQMDMNKYLATDTFFMLPLAQICMSPYPLSSATQSTFKTIEPLPQTTCAPPFFSNQPMARSGFSVPLKAAPVAQYPTACARRLYPVAAAASHTDLDAPAEEIRIKLRKKLARSRKNEEALRADDFFKQIQNQIRGKGKKALKETLEKADKLLRKTKVEFPYEDGYKIPKPLVEIIDQIIREPFNPSIHKAYLETMGTIMNEYNKALMTVGYHKFYQAEASDISAYPKPPKLIESLRIAEKAIVLSLFILLIVESLGPPKDLSAINTRSLEILRNFGLGMRFYFENVTLIAEGLGFEGKMNSLRELSFLELLNLIESTTPSFC